MDAEQVRAQLKRILSSPAFADAERGSRFLWFVRSEEFLVEELGPRLQWFPEAKIWVQ